MDQIKVGKLIAKLRMEKGMTQTELGDILGVSYKAVSKWERGINLPDSSLFKPLCDIFNITIDELMNGKINENTTSNKKNYKILLVIIFLLLILVILVTNKERNKYPKIANYYIDVTSNKSGKKSGKLVNQLLYIDNNIWYYSLNKVSLCTNTNTCYSLGNALNHKQITIDDIHNYLDRQYILGNINRDILRDGGSTIYKSKKYTIIFCNTLKNNHDIYFGNNNLEDDLAGEYCGHKNNTIKYFVRTYHILNIYEDDNEDFVNVTLKEFQGETKTVKIARDYDIKVGYNYEFKFYTYKIFEDTIDNIFKEATLVEIKQTNKVGLEQRNDGIIITE